jgi:hypothetical protein
LGQQIEACLIAAQGMFFLSLALISSNGYQPSKYGQFQNVFL